MEWSGDRLGYGVGLVSQAVIWCGVGSGCGI